MLVLAALLPSVLCISTRKEAEMRCLFQGRGWMQCLCKGDWLRHSSAWPYSCNCAVNVKKQTVPGTFSLKQMHENISVTECLKTCPEEEWEGQLPNGSTGMSLTQLLAAGWEQCRGLCHHFKMLFCVAALVVGAE